MGSKKRKLDVDATSGSDNEPVSESWSKTEQYKVLVKISGRSMPQTNFAQLVVRFYMAFLLNLALCISWTNYIGFIFVLR